MNLKKAKLLRKLALKAVMSMTDTPVYLAYRAIVRTPRPVFTINAEGVEEVKMVSSAPTIITDKTTVRGIYRRLKKVSR